MKSVRAMMRAIAVVGVLSCAEARAAMAQVSVNVGLGAAVPIGHSADRFDAGYNAMVSFSLKPGWMRNLLRIEGAVNGWTGKGTDVKYEVQSLTANLVLLGKDAATPNGYVMLGGGSYSISGGGLRGSHPGVNAGAGIRFPTGFVGTFVEARFHYVADVKKTKYFPMVFGLTY